MPRPSFLVVTSLCGLLWATPCLGQNVSNYDALPEPHLHLFLLREPAVHTDLQLSTAQRQQLAQLNTEIDGPLLAIRNWNAEEAGKRIHELVGITKQRSSKFLQKKHLDRIEQIKWRVRGIKSVLLPEMADQLKVAPNQRQNIEASLRNSQEELNKLRERLRSGESVDALNQLANEVRQSEQQSVLDALTAEQEKALVEILGPVFDLSQLGQVTFKAPELVTATAWINSKPLRLADLQGQVIALHFWAFGCVNCQRNYPSYRDWQETLAEESFQLIGIHTPETSAERNADRVREEVTNAGFKFPVLVDNKRENWNSWGNSMWPSVYLIDKQGRIRYWWYGELNWQGREGEKIMRQRINELVAEPNPV